MTADGFPGATGVLPAALTTGWPAALPPPRDADALGGGMICDTWRVALTSGGTVVAKRTPYPATTEADGLAGLAAVGMPVPDVLAARDDEDGGLLVLEDVGGAGGDPARLGATVAAAHRQGAEQHAGRGYGWERENRIGTLPQPNDPTGPDGRPLPWGRFYAERRVRAHLDDPAVPRSLARRLAWACDGPLSALLGEEPPPAVIHGDLWSGNIVGARWLVDPAVQRADRELELAFATLFGGIPSAFFDGYRSVWPLAAGWERRRPALQLHHLLVHVRHFERTGPGAYGAMVASRLTTLGW